MNLEVEAWFMMKKIGISTYSSTDWQIAVVLVVEASHICIRCPAHVGLGVGRKTEVCRAVLTIGVTAPVGVQIRVWVWVGIRV